MTFEQRVKKWAEYKGYRLKGYDGGFVFFESVEKGIFPIPENTLHIIMKNEGY
ncbi:hypothetical protein MHH70_12425 [Metasolibacillus sp. FSL H7-0170]|uniref:Uncharacterized protein n=1 Tax=Lysinibacillus louembei TaxID=1470088 RepID=A0ABZ0S3Y2_9BACI|nr:hypothetical protein [Lysinibacillus louembei]WPK12257.1 hypothetical protein R6U77_00800 [Lysinibacillus louembei]